MTDLTDTILVRVAAKATIAEGICALALEDASGTPLPPFAPGSHIDVVLPNGLVRQYSLCGRKPDTGAYEIAVLLDPSSRGGSKAVHALSVGDELRIGGPRNFFPLVPDADHYILMAGGIGITPLLSMAERLTEEHRPFELHYCVRGESRIAFKERLLRPPLAACCQVHLDDGPEEQKVDFEKVFRCSPPNATVYVCGPSGFIDCAIASAMACGWGSARIHFERFGSPATPPVPVNADEEFVIRLSRSGLSIRVRGDQTVVEALEENGVQIETACRNGVCGTCRTKVSEGVPDHRDYYLTDDEKAANDEFIPCCSRSLTPVLVVDL